MTPALFRRANVPVWLSIGVVASAVAMTWFGWQAIGGWRQSAAQLTQRRAGETATLLATALARDMRGVQTNVLTSPRADEFMLDAPNDVRALVASAFARYPYPETFFAWRGEFVPANVTFFERVDRRPRWSGERTTISRFPVVVQSNAAIAAEIARQILADAREGRRFSVFELHGEGGDYQVVARLLYRDAGSEVLDSVFGFTVDLAWARVHYFSELTRQVARINGAGEGLALAVRDQVGKVVFQTSLPRSDHTIERPIALAFYDPLLVGGTRYQPPRWTVEARISDDPTLAAAIRAGNRTLLMLGIAAAALGFGLTLAVRAARASARLAELRSDFVSTVTHELKTPIASIRAMGDTLARNRISDSGARAEYAQMIVQESKRLSRLVDNLLAYSRITDVAAVYTFEPIDVHSLVEEVLQGFAAQLAEKGFHVDVEIPPSAPRIRGDRTALELMLDNLVDNAIRYSGPDRWIGVTADRAAPRGARSERADGQHVAITVRDRGIGIEPGDLASVMRRFYRGRQSPSGGSGLGLAIVDRIVADHGGTVSIESTPGTGTIITVTLPAWQDDLTAHAEHALRSESDELTRRNR